MSSMVDDNEASIAMRSALISFLDINTIGSLPIALQQGCITTPPVPSPNIPTAKFLYYLVQMSKGPHLPQQLFDHLCLCFKDEGLEEIQEYINSFGASEK